MATCDEEVYCDGCDELIVDPDSDDLVRRVFGRQKYVFCCQECYQETTDAWREDAEDSRREGWLIDGVGFADPGGRSALRAETASNPRNLPCPTCGQPNRLTPIDRQRGYQCDECSDRTDGGW